MKKLFLIALCVFLLSSCERKDWDCSATIVTHHDGKTDTIEWHNVYWNKHEFTWYTKTDKDKTAFWVVPEGGAVWSTDEHKTIIYPGKLKNIDSNVLRKIMKSLEI